MRFFKVLSICFLLLSISIGTSAQTDKGNFLFGGSSKLNLSSQSLNWKTNDNSGNLYDSFQLEFNPQVGYFVVKGLAIGVEIPISHASSKTDDDYEVTSTSITVAPFARYYFGSKKVKPYVQAEVGFGSLDIKSESANGTVNKTSTTNILIGVEAGVGFFLNESVAIDFGLGFGKTTAIPHENNNNYYHRTNSSFGLNIGFVIII